MSLMRGNPVQSGDVVSSTWANSTLDDVADALTDSLDREGRGGMLAPFRFADGTNLLPGASWVNENTTGFYRFDGGDLRVSVLTQDVMRWQNSGAQVWSVDDSEWQNILTSNTIPTTVPDGTSDGQTLRWDNVDSEWDASSLFEIRADNVRINATVATALDITSTASSSGITFNNSATVVADGTSIAAFGDDNLGLYTKNNLVMTVLGSGNVGIGTDSPNSTLTVEKDTANLAKFTRSSDVEVTVGGSLQVPTVTFTQSAGNVCIGSRDPDTMSFHVGSDTASAASESMRIDSSGNVGIGITNPSQKLDVDGSIKLATDGQVLAGQGVAGGYIGYAFNGDPDTGMFRKSADSIGFATAGVRRMYISSGGIVRVTTDGNDDRVAGTASEAGASTIERFVTLSQSEYNALSPDANTLYIIV